MPVIYLIAGEASGDALGASLMHAIHTVRPDVRFAGVGGNAMRAAGLQSLFPYEALSVMGFMEVLPHIPKFLRLLRETAQDIAAKQPDLVVTIDSPGFNFRLADMLRKNLHTQDIKRIHYVAPSVWAYKPERAAKTARLFDRLLAVLPFEPPYFEKEGLQTNFVGHPVLWQENKGDAAAFRNRHNIAADESVLLVLPGSRRGEVQRHLPIFMEAAKAMAGYKIVVMAGAQVKRYIAENVPQDVVVCDVQEKQDAFAAATLALSKSGTVTLELAASLVPTVVAHKVSALSAWLLKKMILIKYVSLANIALNEEVIPELLQERCTVTEITSALRTLAASEMMQRQKEGYERAIRALRGNNTEPPDKMAAEAVLAELDQSKHIK
ncbi:MAG TPA: lipid-A-disaccharide synthase [Rickettsiales bacterium]|nr:lipid-A-disaccharide synthase [Rickettsiales bacterium]